MSEHMMRIHVYRGECNLIIEPHMSLRCAMQKLAASVNVHI